MQTAVPVEGALDQGFPVPDVGLDPGLVGTCMIRGQRFGAVDPEVAHFLGRPAAELASLGVAGLAIAGDRDRVTAQLRELGRGVRRRAEIVFRVPRADGREVTVELHCRRALAAKQSVVLALVVDASVREAARTTARTRAANYRLLLDQSPDGIALTGASGHFTEVNAVFCDTTGYTRDELLRMTPADLVAEQDRIRDPKLEELLLEGTPVSTEYALRRRDGSLVPVAVDLALLPDGSSHCIARSLAHRQRAEEQIRLLFRAVEQSPASIMITDATGTLVYVNRHFTETTGYTREDALGQTPRILKSGHQSASYYQQLWSSILAGQEWRGLLQNRRKDGTLFWEKAIISPVTNGGGKVSHFIAIKEDVTHQRAIEEQLRQSQKLEAVGLLAGGVAHDFNNMLNVILACATLLKDEIPPESEAAQDLEAILDATRRSVDLTRQLLAFSRKQMLRPQVHALNAIVGGFERMLRRLIREDIVLETSLAADAGNVEADSGQLEQVVLNLALNAQDAMPGGGHLRFTTGSRLVTGRNPNVNPEDGSEVIEPGQYACLLVEDTGSGMDAETRAHIFEPFFTTKGVGQGTGLGLATVYGIIKQSGGYIEVDSTPGRGTRFTILLPEKPPVQAVVETRALISCGDGPLAAAGTMTILLVEDESAVRAVARRILEREGYRVLEASGGSEALALQELTAHPPDLLITDVVMPGMSGPELVQRLAGCKPRLPVLYISGYTDYEQLKPIGLSPAAALLQKPFSPKSLIDRVAQILGASGSSESDPGRRVGYAP